MKKLLLLLVLISAKSIGQTMTRSFPLPASSTNYSFGSSAPIKPTPDGGYLLNYSYSYPNWDVAPGYESTVIKTDSNFNPLWKSRLPGGNGKNTILLNDGSFLFFTDSGNLVKLAANGQTIFSIGNFVTYPERINITDAELIGTTIKAVGSKDTYNGFGYVTISVPLLIDFDSDGNVATTFTLTGSPAFGRPANITSDTSGNFYLTGYADGGNYICKIDSSNNVQWCRKFKASNNDNSSLGINDMTVLPNGEVLLAGRFYNYSTSAGALFIYRLSADGNQISAKTIDTYESGITSISRLPNSEIVATGSLREDANALDRMFSMKLSSNYEFVWLRRYNYGFGMSAPFQKTDGNWYYAAFHNNYAFDNNPILFSTDSEGQTDCDYSSLDLNFIDLPLFFSTLNLTITANSTSLGTPSAMNPFASENQPFTNACISLGSDEFSRNDKLSVFPNPSKREINVVCESQIKSIEVFNALGQQVKKYDINALETSIAIEKSGVYLLKLTTQNGVRNTKVVISE